MFLIVLAVISILAIVGLSWRAKNAHVAAGVTANEVPHYAYARAGTPPYLPHHGVHTE